MLESIFLTSGECSFSLVLMLQMAVFRSIIQQNQCKFSASMTTTKISLDKRSRRNDGTYPLNITISHNNNTARIPLNVWLQADQWDGRAQKVVGHPNKNFLNSFILRRHNDVQEAVLSLSEQGKLRSLTATQLKRKVLSLLNDEQERTNFATWYRHVTQRHERIRTRELYEATWKWIVKFSPDADGLDFPDITADWLQRFDTFVSQSSPSPNARSIHLRNIRAVFNDAIDNNITTLYPFRRFKIPSEATRKRCLTAEQLRMVFNADVPAFRQKYVDVFKLQFFLIGINMVDLCTTAALVDGRVEYRRAKTGRFYSIKAEPEAMEIITKYKGEHALLNVAEGCKDYRHFSYRCDLNLHKVMPSLTTYWSRHSWATIAAELDIPKETISAALGHGGHTVTDIYINFDRRKVDEANRRVIDYVLYGKK